MGGWGSWQTNEGRALTGVGTEGCCTSLAGNIYSAPNHRALARSCACDDTSATAHSSTNRLSEVIRSMFGEGDH
jgi:hypothetical protein